MVDLNSLASRLVTARKAAGLTQEDLAERANSTQRTISSYETGATEPGTAAIVSLCDVLGVSADWLLGRTETSRMLRPGLFLVDLDELDAPQSRNSYAARVPVRYRLVNEVELKEMEAKAVTKLRRGGNGDS